MTAEAAALGFIAFGLRVSDAAALGLIEFGPVAADDDPGEGTMTPWADAWLDHHSTDATVKPTRRCRAARTMGRAFRSETAGSEASKRSGQHQSHLGRVARSRVRSNASANNVEAAAHSTERAAGAVSKVQA